MSREASSTENIKWFCCNGIVLLIVLVVGVFYFAPKTFGNGLNADLTKKNAKKLIKKANKLQRKGKYRAAEKILRQIIANNPQNEKAKLRLAYIFIKENRLRESYEIAFKIAKINSKNSYAFAILGTSLLNAGNFSQARIFLNNSLVLNKREALAWASLGLLNFYQNRIERGFKDLRNAVFLDSKEVDFVYSLAQISARLEKYKESADAYAKYLEIAPNSDAERKERIKGLIVFLRYLGKKASLYSLAGNQETIVPLELIDNRPVIKVKLRKKGPELKFVLDTGSGMTVISKKTAERLKIRAIKKGGKARAIGGDGRFNIVYGFLNAVRIGDVKVKNVPIYIRKFHQNSNDIDGYIGLSLISKYITKIDYGNKTLSLVSKKLYANKQFQPNKNSLTIPLRLTSSGFLSGLVKLEGVESELNFILDTGASVSVISDEISRLEKIKDFALEQKIDVIGAAGITNDVQLFSIPNVTLGSYSSKNIKAISLNLQIINEASGYEQAGILGGNFLKDYSLTFDFEKSKVTFIPVRKF